MKEAKLATVGMCYRRQFAFASIDLALHAPHPEGEPYDAVKISNPILEQGLPADRAGDTTLVAYFGHLNGYDAGYYGYAWADAIAADMATVFEKAKDGYPRQTGRLALAARYLRAGRFARCLDHRSRNSSADKQSIQPF